MSEIDPISPENKAKYHSEFKRGAELFRKALEDYDKSKIPAQKEQFKKVMDEALTVMNQTAKVVCNDRKKRDLEEKVEKDYQNFIKDPSKSHYDLLHKDIESIDKMV